MKHSEWVHYRAQGIEHKDSKIRRQEMLALRAIKSIEGLYILRNAQDSENCSTNGPICSSKVLSADISSEGAEQE
jgi:hypothetical protein